MDQKTAVFLRPVQALAYHQACQVAKRDRVSPGVIQQFLFRLFPTTGERLPPLTAGARR